jgi:hypothetical protein
LISTVKAILSLEWLNQHYLNELMIRKSTCAKERELEENVSQIKIIRSEVQVVQEVVGIGLIDVAAIQFKREEHDERPDHDAEINLANDFLEDNT